MQIQIHDDFNLKKIIESGQCFRAKRLPDGCYRFITKRNILHLSPLRKNLWEADCTSYAWNHIWKSYFDLDTDYNSIRKNIPEDDHFLQKAAMYGKGIRILKQDPFEMLITFIISQRKSIPAIRTAVEKLCRLAGKPLSKEKDIYAFPTAHQLKKLSAEQLKECSLGYRASYVFQAVRLVSSGKININKAAMLTDDELLTLLQQIPGVGIKVASCISLFGFHRTSAAPADVWINRVIDAHYGGINPFPSFGNSAGIMQQYMFYYYKNQPRQ